MRLELPSLGAVLDVALATAKRFPLVLAAAFLAATSAILAFEDIGPDALHDRLLAAATLGLPLLTALTLFGERFAQRLGARALVWLVGVAALAGVYLAWPGWSDELRFARYAQLTVAFHLSAAFLPFVGRDRPNAFWQYNRTLFVRALAAGASSATLWAGLALALAAIHTLFNVDVPEQGYFRLWAVMAFVVATWFFLGGVPRDLDALEEQREYPPVLRVFAQYTLVPLVAVYLVILTLYLGKVVVTWDWPSGWIGWLVSGVATAGVLALLLVHPIADQPDQKWVRTFARDFWVAMLPAVVMLWLALYQRIHQYGVTEPRYFLLALSVWLFAVAAYYTLTRSGRIRAIPASLCVVALLTFAGPWSAYSVSARSQAGRLRGLLERNGVLVGGRLQRPAKPVPADDLGEISAVARYLVRTHGVSRLAPLLGDSLVRRVGGGRGRGEAQVRIVVQALGVEYERSLGGEGRDSDFSFAAGVRGALPAAGYDVLLHVRAPDDTTTGADELTAVLVPASRTVRLARGRETLLVLPLDSLLARVRRLRATATSAADLPATVMSVQAENARVAAVLYVERVNGRFERTGVKVVGVRGVVLLRER
jgi:uncharacterized membrane protein YbaN (DUF454 family)